MTDRYSKEDPITGYIAFERLLDRLLEEAREGHSMRERIGDLTGEVRAEVARWQPIADRAERAEIKYAEALIALEEHKAAAPVLAEFYAAAEAVTDRLKTVRHAKMAAEVKRLLAAMRAAQGYCDPHPF